MPETASSGQEMTHVGPAGAPATRDPESGGTAGSSSRDSLAAGGAGPAAAGGGKSLTIARARLVVGALGLVVTVLVALIIPIFLAIEEVNDHDARIAVLEEEMRQVQDRMLVMERVAGDNRNRLVDENGDSRMQAFGTELQEVKKEVATLGSLNAAVVRQQLNTEMSLAGFVPQTDSGASALGPLASAVRGNTAGVDAVDARVTSAEAVLGALDAAVKDGSVVASVAALSGRVGANENGLDALDAAVKDGSVVAQVGVLASTLATVEQDAGTAKADAAAAAQQVGDMGPRVAAVEARTELVSAAGVRMRVCAACELKLLGEALAEVNANYLGVTGKVTITVDAGAYDERDGVQFLASVPSPGLHVVVRGAGKDLTTLTVHGTGGTGQYGLNVAPMSTVEVEGLTMVRGGTVEVGLFAGQGATLRLKDVGLAGFTYAAYASGGGHLEAVSVTGTGLRGVLVMWDNVSARLSACDFAGTGTADAIFDVKDRSFLLSSGSAFAGFDGHLAASRASAVRLSGATGQPTGAATTCADDSFVSVEGGNTCTVA